VKVPPARIVFSDDDRASVLARIDASLQSGSLTLGDNTREFEAAFAARHGAGHAVATSSGTSALEIIFRSLGVGGTARADDRGAMRAGDDGAGEVLVPANTFFASAAAVLHAGGRVRFADVDPLTMALSPATLDAAVTDRTVGVLLVHIGGLVSPDTPAIAEWCTARGLWLVEDAAHAHGSSLDGRPAGTFGTAAAFSFYPTKVITSGEGGMILTGDDRIEADARIYRDQGKAGFLGGEHVRLGAAWRMSEVHAAIGTVHLARLDEFIARRGAIAARYDKALAALAGITAQPVPARVVSNYYKYVAFLDPGIDRDSFKATMREQHDVGLSGEVYARPLHTEPVFADLPRAPLPVAEDICRRHICLPLHSDMTDHEADYVVDAVRSTLEFHA
jgi:dTDP-4-amino-4,6-dideoxygalactose transaminase